MFRGGLAVALAEAAFPNEFGIDVTLTFPKEWLFSETQSRFVLSVKPERQQAFEKMVGSFATAIGVVTDDAILKVQLRDDKIQLPTKMAKEAWEEAIPCLMK